MIIPLLLFLLELFAVTQQPFEWIQHTSELTSAEPKLITNSTWWVTSLSDVIQISIRFDGQKKNFLCVLYHEQIYYHGNCPSVKAVFLGDGFLFVLLVSRASFRSSVEKIISKC